MMSTTKTSEAVPASEGPQDVVESGYRSPKVLAIGKAIDLLQGATGKHTDGSTGYYWDQEG
jgi:hypothetical protein